MLISYQWAQLRHKLRLEGQIALDFLRKEVLIRGLVLDSNIWMDEKYENFFAVLDWLGKQGYGVDPSRRLALPRVQFDEICLKKSSTEFGTPANLAARIALDRIERLQTRRMVSVDSSFEAKREHGDPALLKLMSSMATAKTPICFISNDVEFRIRAREILGNFPSSPSKLVGIEDEVMPRCNAIIAATKAGANPSFHGNKPPSQPRSLYAATEQTASSIPCVNCNGNGKTGLIFKDPCSVCGGSGRTLLRGSSG